MDPSRTDESFDSYGSDVGEPASPSVRVGEWILVEGNRLSITATMTIGTFLLLVSLGEVGLIAFVNDDSITRLAGGMIAGTFSLITLVVSINQLILSREFAAADEAREQLMGVITFRDDVAGLAEVPSSPAAPSNLLELIAESIHDRADRLTTGVDQLDDDVTGSLDPYTRVVQKNTDELHRRLDQTVFGTFGAVSATIRYDDSWHLYRGRHLRRQHDDELSPEAAEAFDELLDGLELFAVAREHLKTTYLQREVTRFSQLTILLGVPAALAAIIIGLIYADLAGPTIAEEWLPLVTSALTAIVVSPLALLAAYILRSATITRRTASIGPMIPQKDPEAGRVDMGSPADSSGRT